jgi:hypothetical protein
VKDASFDCAAESTLLRSGCCTMVRSGSYFFTDPKRISGPAIQRRIESLKVAAQLEPKP